MTDMTPTPNPVPAAVHESFWQRFMDLLAEGKALFGVVTTDAAVIAPVVAAVDPAIAPEVVAADAALTAANVVVQAGSPEAAISNLGAAIAAAKAVTTPQKP